MRYSNSEVAHKWVHGMFGSNGELEGSNMSATKKSLYSYNTVIAQCLDREKMLFVVIDKSLTPTTAKHVNYAAQAIPAWATVIRTHIPSSRSYDNVDFLGWDKFDKEKRLEMVTIFLRKLYCEYEWVVDGKDLRSENISKRSLIDIDTLNKIYGDCSLKEWLRSCKLPQANIRSSEDFKLRKMVRLYLDGRTDEEITDALFGKGTWSAMQKRIEPLKKGEKTRQRLNNLREHLLYSTERYSSGGRPVCPYNAKQLRKLTAKQRLEIRFYNLERIAEYERLKAKYGSKYGWRISNDKDASRVRACKFIGVPDDKYSSISTVTMPDGTKVYDNGKYGGFENGEYVSGFADFDDNTRIEFDYNSFCAAPDKFVWRERFYKKCQLKMRRLYGAYLFNRRNKFPHSTMNEEQNHIYNEFVIRRNQYEQKKILREKAEQARKAKELQEKLEKIEAYRQHGYEGLRRLWIEHLDSLPQDVKTSPELCYGGNVLLRFSTQSGIVETSLGIRLSFKECHAYWKIIKRWHDNGTFDEGVTMSGYRVQSFENDILHAGCHRIAFCEMQRMYEELCKKDAA